MFLWDVVEKSKKERFLDPVYSGLEMTILEVVSI